MIRSVIFDLDETLLDRGATMRLFLRDQHERFNGRLGRVEGETFADRVIRHQANGYADKGEAYRKALTELGLEDDLAASLVKDYLENYGDRPVLFDGARETLSALSQQYRLALITNGKSKGQGKKITHSGLRRFFHVALVSEEVGVDKPDSRIFEHCVGLLGTKPEETVSVGDHPVNDVEAAMRCGIRGVWLRNAGFPPPRKADAVIDRLEDLSGLLEREDFRNAAPSPRILEFGAR
jgi:putative hydrolase of the HAD superfamily